MLHTSGVPGSVLRMRLGSVTAGRNFAQIASGLSTRPTVLPIDFDIFDWPSSPITRRVGVSSAFGPGKYSSPGGLPASLVPPADRPTDPFHRPATTRHSST